MSEEKKKPIMSLIPFEGVLSEIDKLQGNRPALIVLYTGPEDITILKHNLNYDDKIMDMFMRHLTIEILKVRGIEVSVIAKKLVENNNKENHNENNTKT